LQGYIYIEFKDDPKEVGIIEISKSSLDKLDHNPKINEVSRILTESNNFLKFSLEAFIMMQNNVYRPRLSNSSFFEIFDILETLRLYINETIEEYLVLESIQKSLISKTKRSPINNLKVSDWNPITAIKKSIKRIFPYRKENQLINFRNDKKFIIEDKIKCIFNLNEVIYI